MGPVPGHGVGEVLVADRPQDQVSRADELEVARRGAQHLVAIEHGSTRRRRLKRHLARLGGGRFDLHVRVEKAEKPPVVWVCGADDALPAVGPWTPPRAGVRFEARAQGQGRGRGGGAAKPLTGLAAKEAYYGALRKRSPLAPKSMNVQKDRRALATAAAALKKEIDADQTAMWRAKAQLTKKKEDLDVVEWPN